MQPAALCRGLATSLPANVVVHEETTVTWLDAGPPHELWTDRGSVRTPELLLANNGFLSGFGFYRHHLIPVVTWGSMTRPLTDGESASIGGPRTWGVIPAAPSGTTVRRLSDGRILIRKTSTRTAAIRWLGGGGASGPAGPTGGPSRRGSRDWSTCPSSTHGAGR
ncbi:MAG: hypothetical protein Ct9H300mP31_07010 [Acidimicrobiaceae bacterium]|nr:MAG: hypothetical protein Ct9H300mP31_07010 [Acidimicrobiaceae bacterium]